MEVWIITEIDYKKILWITQSFDHEKQIWIDFYLSNIYVINRSFFIIFGEPTF